MTQFEFDLSHKYASLNLPLFIVCAFWKGGNLPTLFYIMLRKVDLCWYNISFLVNILMRAHSLAVLCAFPTSAQFHPSCVDIWLVQCFVHVFIHQNMINTTIFWLLGALFVVVTFDISYSLSQLVSMVLLWSWWPAACVSFILDQLVSMDA
jgi:hypothetical protein